ncbi:MAG: phenylacetate--CoA ligase family protein [Phycisphaerae bacterium]|nr:phenylacetate--CoA ligase family protein [Phycisphaerae bacterium]
MRAFHRWFSQRLGYPIFVWGRGIRFRDAYRRGAALVEEKRRLSRMPREYLRQRQLELLKPLLVHAGRFSPFYRKRFKEAGFDPTRVQSLEDLAQTPPLTKDDLRAHLDEIICEGFDRRLLFPLATGGSTGAPVRLYTDRKAWFETKASIILADELSGWRPGDPIGVLWGAHFDVTAMKSLVGRVMTLLRNWMVLDSLRMNDATMGRFHAQLSRFGPAVLLGYGSSLATMAAWLKEEGVRPAYPETSIINAAEPLSTGRRALIEEAFGAPVFDRYGARDGGPIAMECEAHAGLHLNTVDLVVEGHGGRPGEPQQLLITNLNAYGMPLIRYRIDDMAVFTDRVCPCGRNTPLLERLVGRVLDMIHTPDGGLVHGGLFVLAVEELPLIEYQFVQEEDFSLTVRIVKAKGFEARHEERIRQIFGEKVPSIPVRIEYVSEVDRTRTGKLKPVVSKVAAGQSMRDGA